MAVWPGDERRVAALVVDCLLGVRQVSPVLRQKWEAAVEPSAEGREVAFQAVARLGIRGHCRRRLMEGARQEAILATGCRVPGRWA